jgi:hypothetical protein
MSCKFLTVPCALLTLAAGSSQAANLTEFFTIGDGTGTTYTPSSIEGQDGGVGWEPSSSWFVTSSATSGTALVEPTAGTDGQLTLTRDASNVNGGRIATGRTYAVPTFAAPYTLNFQMTLNALVNPDNDNEYLQVFDRPGAVDDFGGNGSWLIRSRGDDGTTGDSWYVYDYDPLVANGFNDATRIDTGIDLVEGDTYDFSIGILGGGQWSVTIDNLDDAAAAFSQTGLGFRSADALPSRNLILGIRDFASGDPTPGSYTIDNITIVPEPTMMALFGTAATLLFVRQRKSVTR